MPRVGAPLVRPCLKPDSRLVDVRGAAFPRDTMEDDYSLYGTNSDASGGLLYNLVLCAIYIGGAVAVLQILGQVLQGVAGSLREKARGKQLFIPAEQMKAGMDQIPPATVEKSSSQATETLDAYHARKAFERSHFLE